MKTPYPVLSIWNRNLWDFAATKKLKKLFEEAARLLTWATNHTDSWVVSTWLHTNDENLPHNPADPGDKKRYEVGRVNEWQKLAAYIHSIRVTIRIKLEDKLLRLVSYHCINKVVRQTEWYAFWAIKCFTLSNINFIIKFFYLKYTNEIFTKKRLNQVKLIPTVMNAQRSRSASVKSSRELYTRGIHETCVSLPKNFPRGLNSPS